MRIEHHMIILSDNDCPENPLGIIFIALLSCIRIVGDIMENDLFIHPIREPISSL
jgi:hypothetical protein